MLKIRVLSRNDWEAFPNRHAIRDGSLRVGRDESNDIVISENSVSRFHCRFEKTESGSWEILDLATANGLLLNGRKIQRSRLVEGLVHRIWLGDIEIEAFVDPSASEATGKIDVSKLRSLGLVSHDRSTIQRRLLWLAAGYSVLLVRTLATDFASYDGEPSKAVYDALVRFAVLVGFCMGLSAICKLTRHEYRFKEIYRLVVVAVLAVNLGRLGVWFSNGLIADFAGRRFVDESVDAIIVGVAFVAVLRELFRSLRLGTAVALVSGIIFTLFMIDPVHDWVARAYTVAAEPVPKISYPASMWKPSGDVDALLGSLARKKPLLEKQRQELLKLR